MSEALMSKIELMSTTSIIYYNKKPKSLNTLKLFTFFCEHRFNPIRSQLEAVVGLCMANNCMKEYELIDQTFGLLNNKTNVQYFNRTVSANLSY